MTKDLKNDFCSIKELLARSDFRLDTYSCIVSRFSACGDSSFINIPDNELSQWKEQVEQTSPIRLITKMLPKPNGYARIRAQFTGPLAYSGMIFMDLSFDEPLYLDPKRKRILAEPFLSDGQKVLAYPLEELLAEKIRSLEERGKSRDYCDVWRLLIEKSFGLDFKLPGNVPVKKLMHKHHVITSINDFMPKDTNSFGYNPMSDAGDSSGPWFSGNTVYGIHSAGTSTYAWYMAINYVDGLGVSVMTSP